MLFLIVRIYYWKITNEIPFSDMNDYVRLGTSVFNEFSFSINNFWLSYKPPTFPILVAVYFVLRGGFNVDMWGIFQVLIHLVSLCLLLYNYRRDKLVFKFCLFFIFVVSISSSSIFWSYKVSTEYFTEILIVFLILFYSKMQKKHEDIWVFLSGILTMIAIFHRPQFMLTFLIPLSTLIFCDLKLVQKLKKIALLCIGVFLIWLPWGVRGYTLYGNFIFTSTQGPYSFLWELGDINSLVVNEKTSVTKLQIDAEKHFENDYQAMRHASEVSKKWIKENTLLFVTQIIPNRIWNSMNDRSEPLSKVDRNHLFPERFNWILIQRNWFFIITGLIGYMLVLFKNPEIKLFCLVPLSLWGMGLLFLGYPRILDPSLPLLYAGNIFIFLGLKNVLQQKFKMFLQGPS